MGQTGVDSNYIQNNNLSWSQVPNLSQKITKYKKGVFVNSAAHK